MGTVSLIYCAGGNPAFRRVATVSGWFNGARLPDTVYDPPLYFADQHYRKPNRELYMAALERHKPVMATVLDWEKEEQEAEVMSWAEEASLFVQKVVVIPKVSGTLDRIPEQIGVAEIVLGFSVPTSYGGTTVPMWEFGRRPVHLLGGSPHRQMELARYLNVVSADGSMAQQQANRCRYWSRLKGRKGHWVQLAESGCHVKVGANLEAFRMSCREIRLAWGGGDS